MSDYKERIMNCIDYLNSIRFPCEDWKKDIKYFDELEKDFSMESSDEETEQLRQKLKDLISEKRNASLNLNKTTEELYAGWDDE